VISFASALLRRVRLCDSDVDVVLGGGTLQSGQQLLTGRIETRLRQVAPQFGLRMLDVAAVARARSRLRR
jgi:hypothetical protein